jgi:hypothetical protein
LLNPLNKERIEDLEGIKIVPRRFVEHNDYSVSDEDEGASIIGNALILYLQSPFRKNPSDEFEKEEGHLFTINFGETFALMAMRFIKTDSLKFTMQQANDNISKIFEHLSTPQQELTLGYIKFIVQHRPYIGLEPDIMYPRIKKLITTLSAGDDLLIEQEIASMNLLPKVCVKLVINYISNIQEKINHVFYKQDDQDNEIPKEKVFNSDFSSIEASVTSLMYAMSMCIDELLTAPRLNEESISLSLSKPYTEWVYSSSGVLIPAVEMSGLDSDILTDVSHEA